MFYAKLQSLNLVSVILGLGFNFDQGSKVPNTVFIYISKSKQGILCWKQSSADVLFMDSDRDAHLQLTRPYLIDDFSMSTVTSSSLPFAKLQLFQSVPNLHLCQYAVLPDLARFKHEKNPHRFDLIHSIEIEIKIKLINLSSLLKKLLN